MPVRLILLTLASAVALLVAGCGKKTFDADDMEQKIADAATRGSTVSADSLEISCPDDAEPKKGQTFTCDLVDSNGHPERITVTPTDDEGHFRFEVSRTLHAYELEADLEQQLAPQLDVAPDDLKAECPDYVVPAEGKRFTCDLATPDGERQVEVTLVNAQGRYTAELVGR